MGSEEVFHPAAALPMRSRETNSVDRSHARELLRSKLVEVGRESVRSCCGSNYNVRFIPRRRGFIKGFDFERQDRS